MGKTRGSFLFARFQLLIRIVDKTNEKEFNVRFYALEYLGAIIGEGKKEYLPIIFKETPEADNALAEGIHGLFMGELIDSPKIFLQYLSKEPLNIRKSVYKLLSYTENMYGKERFEKIISNLEEMTKDAEVKKIAEEFLLEVNKKQRKA